MSPRSLYQGLPGVGNFRGDSAFTPGCTASPSTRRRTIWFRAVADRRTVMSAPRMPEFYEGDHALKDIESPERAMLRDEIEATVHRTIQQLPEDLRTALTPARVRRSELRGHCQCDAVSGRHRAVTIFRAREAIDKALQPLLQEA